MHFTAKFIFLAAVNLLAFTTSADAYYDRSHYRRSVNDLSGHPAYYHSESYYYARPSRIYRRTKLADPNTDNSEYQLKVHIIGGNDDKGPGHTTLFVTKVHSGKNTKHQAKQKPGTEIDPFGYLTYMYDKQKMDPSISKHTPESLHQKALAEKKRSELHVLGTWKGKEAGKKLKAALTPPANMRNGYKYNYAQGCHMYALGALERIQKDPALAAGLNTSKVATAQASLNKQCIQDFD